MCLDWLQFLETKIDLSCDVVPKVVPTSKDRIRTRRVDLSATKTRSSVAVSFVTHTVTHNTGSRRLSSL